MLTGQCLNIKIKNRPIDHLHTIRFDYKIINRMGGVMVSVLASTAVDSGFDPRRIQTKDFKIGMCCFSAKHAALMRKNKDWLARNQNNVSKWSDTSTCRLLFQ